MSVSIILASSSRVSLLSVFALWLGSSFTCFALTAEEIAALRREVVQLRDEYQLTLAIPLAEKLVKITSQYYGHDSVETANAFHQWAWLVQKDGHFIKAERLWQEALAVDENVFGKGTVQTTKRMHLLADLYCDSGSYERADNLLGMALVLREEHYGPHHPETAEILHSLGKLRAYSADYAAAETYLARALSAFEDASYLYPEVANTLGTMGKVAAWRGDHELAEQRMLRSIEIRKRFHGLEDDGAASSYSDLAEMHYFRREFARAIPHFQKALEIREKLYGANHLKVAHVLSDLGASYLGHGDLRLASSTLQRAYQLLERHLGPANLRVAEVIDRLCDLNERQGNLPEAKRLCDRQYDIKRSVLGSSHYYTIKCLRDQVRLSALLGDPEPALRAADAIQQNEETLLQNLLSFTSERQRLFYQQNTSFFRSRFRLWADLGAVRPLARAIFRTKGLVLDSLLEDRLLAESHATEHVRELISQLNEVRRRATQLLPASGPAGFDWQQNTNLQALSAEAEVLQAELARQVTGIGRTRRALSIRLEDVQAALPEGTVLLELLRYSHRIGKRQGLESYGALMVTRREEPRWVFLGAADDIERSIKMYQHAVRNAESEPLLHSLTELYRQLWTPLLPHLSTNTKSIIISPDGLLNSVSFVTLVRPDKTFLGEQYWFSYVSCGRDLTAEAPVSTSRELLVFANPDFVASPCAPVEGGTTVRRGNMRGLDFRPLPGAEAEGRDVVRWTSTLGFTNSALYLGGDATEDRLLRVRSPKVLHLATHGFLLPEMSAQKVDPMMRSGLALAGARRTLQLWAKGKETLARNDGILTADDICVLNLQRTWLVVLSACDTGLGEVRAGEGVFGLRRGFTQAGAQNLLLTLWPIDDKRTRELISNFYTQLHLIGNPSHALADAQRKWLKRLRAESGLAEACKIAGPFILSFQGRSNLPPNAP